MCRISEHLKLIDYSKFIIGGRDYLDIGPQTFHFKENSTNTTFTLSIPLVDNDIYELTEVLVASLTILSTRKKRFFGWGFPAPEPTLQRVTSTGEDATINIVDDDGM